MWCCSDNVTILKLKNISLIIFVLIYSCANIRTNIFVLTYSRSPFPKKPQQNHDHYFPKHLGKIAIIIFKATSVNPHSSFSKPLRQNRDHHFQSYLGKSAPTIFQATSTFSYPRKLDFISTATRPNGLDTKRPSQRGPEIKINFF